MDLGRPTTTTEARALIGMMHYYRYMCPRRSRVLSPLVEAASGPKVRKILSNDALESSFKELNRMISAKTLLSYQGCTIPFTVHNDDYYKQVGAVVGQNNKSVAFLSIIFSKPQLNYNRTEK